MAGTYTEILIMVPTTAKAGAVVAVEARITNLCGDVISALPGFSSVNGMQLFPGAFDELVQTIRIGETASWHDSFMMPESDASIHAESWFEGAGLALHKDDEVDAAISLPTAEKGFPWLPVGLLGGALAVVALKGKTTK